MAPPTPLFVSLLLVLLAATAAAINDSDSYNYSSVSLNVALPYSEDTMYSEERARARQRERDSGREAPPGADSGPRGVFIYNSVDQVPTARLLGRATKMQTCYASTDGARQRCWAAYVCGHRCEPVLLAIDSFCKRDCPRHDKSCAATWVRCQKARKFNRCFARLCFRTGSIRAAGATAPTPVSYEDPLSVSIVRYRRPVSKKTPFL